MCCLTQNCIPSAWPLVLTLIQECTLRITSYKHSALSPSYSLPFINHSNWEGVLWIVENTGHAIAVIPLSLQKLPHYAGCFLDTHYSQKTKASYSTSSFGYSPKTAKEESLREGVRGICPCRQKQFSNSFELVHMWMTSMCAQWDVIWRTVIFMAGFFAAHNLSFLGKQMCSVCAESCFLH